ncbi:hypothetical protein VP01_865g3 [Puccinia sorghi]|uniref:Uncharacterized protein n=1 Tax=Puccinia sorghi TaxID=27349 RepID=A0A0L6U8S6_9BASI|nr:hypothetical protein VP01_865g3 [Puccinia sorghi]
MSTSTQRRPPAETASIEFEPYNTSNRKAELLAFIYQVEPHAQVGSKVKVDQLRQLASKYLEKLKGLDHRRKHPDWRQGLADLNHQQGLHLNPQQGRLDHRQEPHHNHQPELTGPQAEVRQNLHLEHRRKSMSSLKKESLLKQEPSTWLLGNLCLLLQSKLVVDPHPESQNANCSPSRLPPPQDEPKPWHHLESQPKRYQKQAQDSLSDDEDASSDVSESGSFDSQSDTNKSNSSDSDSSDSLSSESEPSSLESDKRGARKRKGKAKAQPKPSEKITKYSKHTTRNSKKKHTPPPRSSRPLKSALSNKNKSITGRSRRSKNKIIEVDSGTEIDDRRYHTRSGYRPPPRPPSPDLDAVYYAEEGRQEANSYSRPQISSYLQDRNQLNHDMPPAPASNQYGHSPCPKRRRYIQLGGANQMFASGFDNPRDKDGPSASDWRFTPASVPFSSNPEPRHPSASYTAQTWNSGQPNFQFSQSNHQANTATTSQYQPNHRPTSASGFYHQPTHCPTSPAFSSQPNVAPSFGYNTSQSNVSQSSTPYDYSPHAFNSDPKTQNQSNPQEPDTSSGPRSAPSLRKDSSFNFSFAPGTVEQQAPPPSSVFGHSETLGNPPPPPSRFGQSGFQGNHPPAPPPSRFYPSAAQEKAPPPAPSTQLNQSSAGTTLSSRFSEAEIQAKPQLSQFGHSSFSSTPTIATTFRPTTSEPMTNNPFMPGVSSNLWDPKPAPPPPRATNLWGVKPILKSAPQAPMFSSSKKVYPPLIIP